MSETNADEREKVQQRKLGKTDMDFSEVALGLWALTGASGPVSDELIKETLEAAFESGINVYDMAPLWGAGSAETIVGATFKEKRDEVRYVTRAGVVWENDDISKRFDLESLEADCNASLKRLDTAWIDLWLLHDPPEEVALDEKVYELAKRLKAEGMIRAFGISTANVDVARTAIGIGVDAICLPVNMLHADNLKDLEADIEDAGCGVLASSPLCHGLLSGRWTEYRRFAEHDHRFSRWTSGALKTRVRTVNKLRYMVHDDVENLSTAALRYVLGQKGVTSAVLGAKRPAQVQDAARMAGKPPYLPQDDLERLGQVLADAGA
ncbi:MAG: aryl-alcohol dehydrogenase-like predicted oxidoreductase [Polyangiales bacterium]